MMVAHHSSPMMAKFRIFDGSVTRPLLLLLLLPSPALLL